MALKKGAIPLAVLAGVILIIAVAGTGCTSTSNQSTTYSPVTAVAKNVTHYMDSLPFPNEVFPGTPVNVVIDVDMDLAAGSSMSVKNGNTEFGVGQTIIDPSKVTLRQMFNPSAPDGTYTVTYTTCWADTGKCEDGNFQFSINRTLAASYTDWRGKQDATINIMNDEKDPRYVKVSPGTQVTWVNDDMVNHTADSDTHMTHSNFPSMDSGDIVPNGTFSLRFDLPGVYPYHCSEHPETEQAVLIVL